MNVHNEVIIILKIKMQTNNPKMSSKLAIKFKSPIGIYNSNFYIPT